MQQPPSTLAPETPGAEPPPAPISRGYRNYVLAVLFLVYVSNFIDRQILSILLEAIKQDLQLSDTALGFLTGFAFAVFYTFAGIPLARWADVGIRRNIIALGIVIWSGMTALTGMAQSFTQLAIARIGVGIGEAACSPPAHSLISDYFPPQVRATALSIYSLGIPVGAAIGILAGGWIGQFFGWRMAFVMVGLPGLALAVLVRLTLREPVRGHSEGVSGETRKDSVGTVLHFMWSLPSFRHLSFGAALHAFVGYGAGAFAPAFFIRVHGMETWEVAKWLGLIALFAGSIGTFLGGAVADRLARRDMRWYMWWPAMATLLYVPFAFLYYLWPEPRMAIMMAVPAAILGPMYLGPTFAMTQALARIRMRALASAFLLFVLNFIGLGAGPQAVGFASDLLHSTFGNESLRYALLFVVVPGSLWSALHYLLAGRTLREDLLARDRPEEPGLSTKDR